MKQPVGVGSERGVSPVIGVVLLVAVVVILAATVGVYVLQFTDERQGDAPRIGINAEYNSQNSPNGEYINLSIKSGETVETENLQLAIRDAVDSSGGSVDIDRSADPLGTQAGTELVAGDEISVGANQVTPTPSGHLDLSDAEIQLVWNPADVETDESAIIWRWEP